MELFIKLKSSKLLLILLFLVVVTLPGLASAMTVTVGVPEKYSEIKAGEKVYFETEVKWPENVGRKDLQVEYLIKDKDGNEAAYLKVLKAIETQASFMDSISIPESTKPGIYKIEMKLGDYKDLNQNVTASFKVAKGGNSTQTYLFVIIGLLSVVTIFVIIEMFVITKRHNV